MRNCNIVSLCVFLLAVLLVSQSSFASQYVYIVDVPDWDQPVQAAGQASTPASPAAPWRAWCVPTAMANIVGFYNDNGVMNIGDSVAWPGTSAWPDPVWQDETADAVSLPGLRFDLGWYFNTNDMGLGGIPVTPAHTGTKIQHIRDGATGAGGLIGAGSGYFPTRGQNFIDVVSYGSHRLGTAMYAAFDTTGDLYGGHSDLDGFATQIILSITTGELILAHFDHFNLMPKTRVTGDPVVGDYDKAEWGVAPLSFPNAYTDETSGEVWHPSAGLGHTVTVVGFWPGVDPGNPLGAQDAIIVHDNVDGYLSASAPLPLVIPWTGSPWMGLTVIHSGIQLSVQSPNGGENLIADSNSVVAWSDAGTVADVRLEYTTNNGGSWSSVSPANVGNSGSHIWRTPVVTSDQCRIKVISEFNDGMSDVSDSVFTIYECTLSYDVAGNNCFVDLADLRVLLTEWMSNCGNPYEPGCP